MPAVTPVQYPKLNSVDYDWSSALINLQGANFQGFKSLNYSQTLDPSELRGTRSQAYSRTRGKYAAEGSCEIYLDAWEPIAARIAAMGLGLLEASFFIVVHYSEGTAITTDTLAGVRFKKLDTGGSEGGEGLVMKADLSIMYLLLNGRVPFNPLSFLKGGSL